MNVQGEDVYDVWLHLLEKLLLAPVVKPRGKWCRELIGVQLAIRSAQQNIIVDPQRSLNYRFMVAEWLWILTGSDDVASLARYNSHMRKFSDDGVRLAGAYGPRIMAQWPWLLKKLVEDPETRQAVVQIWTPAPPDSKDIPCTLSLQFLLRGGELRTVVTMRSSDAWLGLPYDVFSFSMLANLLAVQLAPRLERSVRVGELCLNLGSSHLYQEHHTTARSIVNAPLGAAGHSPALTESVPFVKLTKLLANPPTTLDAESLSLFQWPWSEYAKVLCAKTSLDAFFILENLNRRQQRGATTD